MGLTFFIDGKELPDAELTFTNDPEPGSTSLLFDPDIQAGQIMTIGARRAGYRRYRVKRVETVDYPEPRWVEDDIGDGRWVSGYQTATVEPI